MSEPRLAEFVEKKVVAFGFTWEDEGMENDFEVESGQVSLYFDDGTRATFTAVWHNDSTAGLYCHVGPGKDTGEQA